MLALFRIVKVLMLDQHLAHGILLPDKVTVLLHQDALTLRSVVGLGVHAVAGQLMPCPLHIIKPPDFRRAGRDPNHAGAQFSAQTGEDIIVNVGVLTANQCHGANLADQLKIVFHTPFLSFLLGDA